MCITVRPSVMSNTRIYAGRAQKDDQEVHVLAYQNKAVSLAGNTSFVNRADNKVSVPNGMLLPIPSTHRIGPENIIDTREFKGFLADIVESTKAMTKSASRGYLGFDKLYSKGLTKTFDVGSYTIITGQNPVEIMEALNSIPEEKRPEIDAAFLALYANHYKDSQLVLCCWSGEMEAEPILIWYTPIDPARIFVPTADAHDGKMPRFNSDTHMDHVITTNTNAGKKSYHKNPITYSNSKSIPDSVRSLLPNYAEGIQIKGHHPNVDRFIVHEGDEYGHPLLNAVVHTSDRMNGWG